MISHFQVWLRNVRSTFSRSELGIHLLGLSRLRKLEQKPGLVMVQIDGLSLAQFERAVKDRHLPFLNALIKKERYVLRPFYSGLPSNTPAVQGEIFYGVQSCVPAFSFKDLKTGHTIKMFESAYVEALEKELAKQGDGLLTGGSSYSNIFTGGAKEAHCCWGKIGWSGVWHAVNPLIFPFLFILYIDIFLRTFVLLVVEMWLAVAACIWGTLKGKVFLKEIESIWLRVLVCVCLREFITAGASIDIMRGLPIIHLNFLGYDEQAHARGPSSRFAHWSLQGIDDAIRRVDKAIKRSPFREYDLWVYSDHGQEATEAYELKYKSTIEQAVKKIFLGSDALVTVMGPMGHIYAAPTLTQAETRSYAQKLVSEAHIPLVITRLGNQKFLASTESGQFILPDESAKIFGRDHPFLAEVTEDMLRVCAHPDAGDFVIAGWSQGETAVSFALESGGHAGAAIEETRAFALLPSDIPVELNHKSYLRPMHLRKAARHFMDQSSFLYLQKTDVDPIPSKNLRIMSYNVHGCKGMDGRVSTERIARVIARYGPDIVALQELDAGRSRSLGINQVEMIAQKLGMSFQFHPARRHQKEEYGNAILSRYPMEMIKKDSLPKLWNRTFLEPRGAIWVIVNYQGSRINIINTHLSLWSKERRLQMTTLLSGDWMRHPDCSGPIILCGDLNMAPNTAVYKEIIKNFNDSQLMLSGHKPVKTWFSGYPFRRIDHVFISAEFSVRSIEGAHTALDRMASDHLPVTVDLSLKRVILNNDD